MNTKDALLEIGCEELPASFVPLGIEQLQKIADTSLKDHQLSCQSIHVYGTPRRLAVVLKGLADHSEDQTKVISGPPAEMAKDASGEWTPATLGFARKQGVHPDSLTISNGKLSATLHIPGVPTRQLLAQLFPEWIRRLQFPKSMVWEPSGFRFPRPIRWLTAVYAHVPVSFSIAGVRSGKWTVGLVLYSSKKIVVAQPGAYVSLLKNQCVLVEPLARVEAIRKLAEQAARRLHGRALIRESLLEQVSNLLEHPSAILGNFDPAYLALPAEVLITCLEHHQKFFPVAEAASDTLLPHFVGIRNGMSVNMEVVREGYERVLAARLADARFFFDHDRKMPLVSKMEALRGVLFQSKLGNLFEKKERVKQLLQVIGSFLGGAPWLAQAERAADLCKADLVTDMVREFPELQGIMARLYAQADGEDPAVAQALEQHYWPITLSGVLPTTDVATAVALADKLDTLAGDFAVGLIPSGSADPYGLRRAAGGVLRLLEERSWPLSLEKLIEKACDLQPENVRAQAVEAAPKLVQFMKQRWSALLEERGYKFDEIDAVLTAGVGQVRETLDRLKALHELRSQKEFEPLSVAFKRSINIVRQADKSLPIHDGAAPLQADLLREPCEQALYQAIESTESLVAHHVESRAYREALASLVCLRDPLDGFFNGVMVMAEDPALRANRLALLGRLVRLFSRIADFSKLQNA
ncbi:MAG: glycine--tRNA ligase subunit beta [Elusimicrobiota bacterium]|jgi:glycyl-tRNA synthetase beta chain